MGVKLNFVFAVVFILHVSAKPFAEKRTCKVSKSYSCGQEECPCPDEVIEKSTWKDFLNNIILRPAKKCYCNKTCKKIVEVECREGICDQDKNVCKCFPCWTGTSCSKYENKYKPQFTSSFTEINFINNKTVNSPRVLDKDASHCKDGIKCPCADVRYALVDGGDGTFVVNEQSGHINMISEPFKDDYLLVVGASNKDEKISSKAFVQINTRNYVGKRTLIHHSRARRSVTAGSLLMTLQPILSSVFYFNIGESITFQISLSHNASVSTVPASNVVIRISSEFLQLTTAGLLKSQTGSFTASEAMDGAELVISLSGAEFGTGNRYDANITTTVKDTIGPLSNLKLSAELNATSDIYIKETSNPVVHAVYPQVNLTSPTVESHVATYTFKNFSMRIAFPKLNYSLFVELTTNIEDFIFMIIQDVKVSKEANIQYNGTATPQYFSTNADGKNDRVVIDFGFVRNNYDADNAVTITFAVKVLDHVLLANNSKHWIGVGLQAGLRVLWVEQQSFSILKVEPSLELELVATNFTNLTRLYIGDNYPVAYTIKHTNTSTANAANVQMVCVFANLVIPNAEVTAGKVSKVNDTTVIAKPNGHTVNALNLGSTLQGTFNLELPSDATPFIETSVKCIVDYKNTGGVSKDSIKKDITPSTMAGSPSSILSINGTNNLITPGEKRQYAVNVLLSKMRSPIRFELVMPMIGNDSVFHIVTVHDAVIGENIKGLNASAKPVFVSTAKNGINNAAIYDLGIATNLNATSADNTKDTISFKFDVILLDNNNVTNGTTQWVGAGLVSKPKMIWVGQIEMTTIVPVDSRPWLNMKPSIIPLVDGKQYSDYLYNILLSHKPISNQLAYDVKIRFFLPDYVQFVSMTSESDPRLSQKQFGGSRFFEIKDVFNFPDNFNFTFKVQVDPSKFPHDGKVFITTPIYLLYKNRLGQQFTLVKLLRKSLMVPQKLTIPTVSGVSEHYDKGISWKVNSDNTYSIYVCSNDKAKRMLSACYTSTDKGNTWKAVDSRVASILGHDSSNNLYGIAKNKRAYMKFDNSVNSWISIPGSEFNVISDKYTRLTDGASTGDPATHKVVGADHWGVSKDGVFIKPGGSGSWIKKSIWL